MNAQVTIKEANQIAQHAADQFGLPQTVFKTADTYGWANTNPMSNNLRGAKVFATWLPSNYFS